MKKIIVQNKLLKKRYLLGDMGAGYLWAKNLISLSDTKYTVLIITLLRDAIDAEINIAAYDLAQFYECEWNLKRSKIKALKWYKYAANKGIPSAHNQLGVYYEGGIYIKKNTKKAMGHYKKGAIMGDVLAQFNLAQNYENGIGAKKNIREALRWYEMSMLQGFKDAQEKFNQVKTTLKSSRHPQ